MFSRANSRPVMYPVFFHRLTWEAPFLPGIVHQSTSPPDGSEAVQQAVGGLTKVGAAKTDPKTPHFCTKRCHSKISQRMSDHVRDINRYQPWAAMEPLPS